MLSCRSAVGAYTVWSNGKAYFCYKTQHKQFGLESMKVDACYPRPIDGN